MKIFLKKFITTFSLLSVIVWSGGATAFAEQPTDTGDQLTSENTALVSICHTTGEGTMEIEVASEAIPGHLEHGDTVGQCPPPPVCGNGVLDPGEQCDDGPSGSATCTANCTLIETEECSGQNNLFVNGSFEEPTVTDSSLWQKMSSVFGWVIENVSDNSATTLELHKGWSSNIAANGLQYSELDGDQSTRITQNIVTEAGAQYKLFWSFAARHDIAAEQNNLAVEVNGNQVATNGPVTGIAPITQSNWVASNHVFTADSANTEIAFKDIGPSDSYGTFLDNVRLCKIKDAEPKVTIKAHKIVCDSEEYAPNMSGRAVIDSSTAQSIVDNSGGHCDFMADWQFQWGKNNSLLALHGDYVGKHINDGWYDFSSVTGSDSSTPAEVTVSMSDVPSGNRLWFREVLEDGYVPFSFPSEEYPSAPGSDISAEFWCNQDVANYDNAEWIDVSPANTYYCVGINVLKEVEPAPYAPWCSALMGVYRAYYNSSSSVSLKYSDVIDINNDSFINLSDWVFVVQKYFAGNDADCYQQFEDPQGQFHFSCENYTDIGWCQGLQQGVKDSLGAHTGDSNYSAIYDLNDDGVMDILDWGLVTQMVYQDDQAACYAHFVPPMPQCPAPVDQFCGDGQVTGTEECDGSGPVACITEIGGYAGTQTCHMPPPPSDFILQSTEEGPAYCVFDPCIPTQSCGDGTVNGNEVCDDGPNGSDVCTPNCTAITPPNPQPGPSGGGGGGGFIPINIFNVQNSVTINSANITWETTRQSLTWILYGTTSSYGSEYQGTNYHATHTMALADLLPGTLYHYQIRAKDSGNHTAYDIDRTFTTPGLAPQVLGIKEIACKPDVDGDIKGVMKFIAGSLIRGCGPEVYHVLGNDLFHIPNWQYLHDNYFAQRIYNVTDEVIAQYGQTLIDDKTVKGKDAKILGVKFYADGTLLKAGDGKIYVIINGKKVHIISLEDLKKYSGNKIYNVTDTVLNQY